MSNNNPDDGVNPFSVVKFGIGCITIYNVVLVICETIKHYYDNQDY